MSKEKKRLPLFQHSLDSPSAFTPESLQEAVSAERNLPLDPVLDLCVREFDGDCTGWLVATVHAKKRLPWACFHTSMETVEVDGDCFGLIARTIGGPTAVLVAEQLAASGARVNLGLSSAGQVSPGLSIPSIVVSAAALHDERTLMRHASFPFPDC
jgi:hypothetical protein